MKTICLFLAAVMLLSATIPMAMPSDALADNGKLYSGGAIDSSGRFSLTAVEFMEELISVMNSNTALSALDATFSALGDSSISLSPEFTYYYQDESFYILQYTGMEIGAVSFLKDGNPASGSSNFDSVGVDLIFGFPKYTKDILVSDIDQVLKYPIEHISLYMFMPEEGTILGDKCIKGDLEIPNDDLLVEQMEYVHGQLVKNGFFHYEISNFAKNNKFCRHNLKYWNFEEYLGFGSSACSFVKRERFKNISDPFQYCKNIKSNISIKEYSETLPLKNSEGEFVMLKLRLARGLSSLEFYKNFGEDFEKVYFKELQFLIKNGFIEKKSQDKEDFFYIPYNFFSIQSEIAKYFII